jgi:hypothetical protein
VGRVHPARGGGAGTVRGGRAAGTRRPDQPMAAEPRVPVRRRRGQRPGGHGHESGRRHGGGGARDAGPGPGDRGHRQPDRARPAVRPPAPDLTGRLVQRQPARAGPPAALAAERGPARPDQRPSPERGRLQRGGEPAGCREPGLSGPGRCRTGVHGRAHRQRRVDRPHLPGRAPDTDGGRDGADRAHRAGAAAGAAVPDIGHRLPALRGDPDALGRGRAVRRVPR